MAELHRRTSGVASPQTVASAPRCEVHRFQSPYPGVGSAGSDSGIHRSEDRQGVAAYRAVPTCRTWGQTQQGATKKKKESRANGLRRRPAASTTGGTQRPPSNNPEQGVPRGRGLKRRPADSSTASIQRPRAIGPVHGESRPSQWDRPEGDRPGGIGCPRIDRLIEQIPESEPPFNFKVQATTALVANIPKDRELRSLARQKLKDIGFQNVSCLRGIVGRTVVTACKQASGLVQELTLSRSHNVDAVKGMRKVRMRSKTAERAPGAFGCAMTHNRILQLIQSNSTYFVDNSTTRRQYALVAEDDIVTCRG